MTTKPMKTLESHYPIIQVLIIACVCHRLFTGFDNDVKTGKRTKQLRLGVNVFLSCLLTLEHLLFLVFSRSFVFVIIRSNY